MNKTCSAAILAALMMVGIGSLPFAGCSGGGGPNGNGNDGDADADADSDADSDADADADAVALTVTASLDGEMITGLAVVAACYNGDIRDPDPDKNGTTEFQTEVTRGHTCSVEADSGRQARDGSPVTTVDGKDYVHREAEFDAAADGSLDLALNARITGGWKCDNGYTIEETYNVDVYGGYQVELNGVGTFWIQGHDLADSEGGDTLNGTIDPDHTTIDMNVDGLEIYCWKM